MMSWFHKRTVSENISTPSSKPASKTPSRATSTDNLADLDASPVSPTPSTAVPENAAKFWDRFRALQRDGVADLLLSDPWSDRSTAVTTIASALQVAADRTLVIHEDGLIAAQRQFSDPAAMAASAASRVDASDSASHHHYHHHSLYADRPAAAHFAARLHSLLPRRDGTSHQTLDDVDSVTLEAYCAPQTTILFVSSAAASTKREAWGAAWVLHLFSDVFPVSFSAAVRSFVVLKPSFITKCMRRFSGTKNNAWSLSQKTSNCESLEKLRGQKDFASVAGIAVPVEHVAASGGSGSGYPLLTPSRTGATSTAALRCINRMRAVLEVARWSGVKVAEAPLFRTGAPATKQMAEAARRAEEQWVHRPEFYVSLFAVDPLPEVVADMFAIVMMRCFDSTFGCFPAAVVAEWVKTFAAEDKTNAAAAVEAAVIAYLAGEFDDAPHTSQDASRSGTPAAGTTPARSRNNSFIVVDQSSYADAATDSLRSPTTLQRLVIDTVCLLLLRGAVAGAADVLPRLRDLIFTRRCNAEQAAAFLPADTTDAAAVADGALDAVAQALLSWHLRQESPAVLPAVGVDTDGDSSGPASATSSRADATAYAVFSNFDS
jgi:hypothetical protein